jgi:hypothetical protein
MFANHAPSDQGGHCNHPSQSFFRVTEHSLFLIFCFIIEKLTCELGPNNQRQADRALGVRPTWPRPSSEAAIGDGAN